VKREKSIRVARVAANASRTWKLTGKSACRNAVTMLIPTFLVAFILN
jgi:hypothetical protein